MNINNAGLELIMKWEGFKAKPYYCPAGVPTIGYGTTVYPNGRKVAMSDVTITTEQAMSYLKFDCAKFERVVSDLVKSNINENQFSALVSFAYNLGGGALSKSTLLKKVNADPDDVTIAAEFLKYSKARVNGVLTPLNGLFKRRNEEQLLYFLPSKKEL